MPAIWCPTPNENMVVTGVFMSVLIRVMLGFAAEVPPAITRCRSTAQTAKQPAISASAATA